MTQLTLKADTSVAEGFHRVFQQAIEKGENLRLIAVGSDEEFTFANLTEVIFYADGFLAVTPESTTVSLYQNVQRLSSRVRD